MSDMRLCTIAGCGRKLRAKGLCAGHYYRATHGLPVDVPLTPLLVDRVGFRKGRLVVLARSPSRGGRPRWVVRCDCGVEKVMFWQTITGNAVSCGCYAREKAVAQFQRHGHNKVGRRTREYQAWASAIDRCHNPRATAYPGYGARGIHVCELWRHSFDAFLADMGPAPTQRHTLDRIDNTKGYEPGNCRWATAREQANNTRANRRLTWMGITATAAQWARALGVRGQSITNRIDCGEPVEEVFATYALRRRPPRPDAEPWLLAALSCALESHVYGVLCNHRNEKEGQQ